MAAISKGLWGVRMEAEVYAKDVTHDSLGWGRAVARVLS